MEPPCQACKPHPDPPISVTSKCHIAVALSQIAFPPQEVVANGVPSPYTAPDEGPIFNVLQPSGMVTAPSTPLPPLGVIQPGSQLQLPAWQTPLSEQSKSDVHAPAVEVRTADTRAATKTTAATNTRCGGRVVIALPEVVRWLHDPRRAVAAVHRSARHGGPVRDPPPAGPRRTYIRTTASADRSSDSLPVSVPVAPATHSK